MGLPDFSERDRRRLLVNDMHMKGWLEKTMVEHLDAADPPVWPADRTLKWKLKKIKEDLEQIREDNLAAFAQTKETADAARVEYIGLLRSLYQEARENGDIKTARSLAKDLAHVHGIATEEPEQQQSNDPIEMLAFAVQSARKQLKAPTLEIESSGVVDPEDLKDHIQPVESTDPDVGATDKQ